jgi:hypothetical protein
MGTIVEGGVSWALIGRGKGMSISTHF